MFSFVNNVLEPITHSIRWKFYEDWYINKFFMNFFPSVKNKTYSLPACYYSYHNFDDLLWLTVCNADILCLCILVSINGKPLCQEHYEETIFFFLYSMNIVGSHPLHCRNGRNGGGSAGRSHSCVESHEKGSVRLCSGVLKGRVDEHVVSVSPWQRCCDWLPRPGRLPPRRWLAIRTWGCVVVVPLSRC